jgi:8-oxo-dGTP pyrophosphatase MutT (NUDIX family)
LRTALAGELPGPAAQLRLAPRPRVGWKPGECPEDCRHSGTLVLLYPRAGETHLLLTLRDRALQNHAGQVSFPGGAVEPGESFAAAALREAQEETGVEPATVRVLGTLSPLHVPVSRFVVHPHVAITPERPDFRPKRGEVARLLEVPLEDLRDPSRLGVEPRRFGTGEMQVPFLHLNGEKVWGATGMVLAEFLTLLGSPPDPWGRVARG